MTIARQSPARPTSLLAFGAVADGPASSSAATSAALNAFGRWARAESAAGRAVHVTVPPGTYHFDQVAAADCFKGIATLVFSAYGATFLQTSPTGFPWPIGSDTLFFRNAANPLIRSARKGATRVVASTPSELRHFAAGEMVMIAGLDLQYGGYPPNLYCFDFVRIERIDPASGAMAFTPPLNHDYQATFPAYPALEKFGRSRIFKLDRNGFTWDIDHSFLGVTCRHGVKAHSNYIPAQGRKLTFRDCDVPGFAESICEAFLAERCIERLYTEPDKLVRKSVRRHGDLRAGFGLQSASIDLAIAEDCTINLVAIGGKKLVLRNCTIGQVGYGGLLGFNDEAVFEGCRIASAPYFFPYPPTGARYNFVDGVNVTYADGIFTVLKNDQSGIAHGGGLANWNLLPGQPLSFCRGTPGDTTANGSHIASDLGAGRVVSISDRPDAVVIATTLKAARVPAWSSGQIFVKRRNPPVLRDCTGAEPVRLAAEAARAGKDFGAYFRYRFDAANIAQGAVMQGRTGRLVRFRATVVKPMTGRPDAMLTIGETAAYRASTMDSPCHYQIDIDLTVPGVREFSETGLRGSTGKDRVSCDGARQATLPADRWCENGMPLLFCTGAPFTAKPADAPVVELIFEFDMGLLGRHTVIGPLR